MKFNLRAMSMALAAAGLMVSVSAHADFLGFPGFGEHEHDTDVTANISLKNKAEIKIKNKVETNVRTDVDVDSHIRANSNVSSLVDDKQISTFDVTGNDGTRNSAQVGNNALNNANGNIGVNAAAGSGNEQANMTAIAASGSSAGDGESGGMHPSDVTGGDDGHHHHHRDAQTLSATVNVYQDSEHNLTFNHGSVNRAQIGSNVLNGAQGNIGVNAAAGSGNQQKNDTALASSGGNVVNATATGTAIQQSFGSVVDNDLADYCVGPNGRPFVSNTATAGNNVLNWAKGNIGVNVAAGSGNQQLNSLSMSYASK